MSCFYVGDKHINWIVSYANQFQVNEHPSYLIGMLLAHDNYNAVINRYGYQWEDISYSFEPIEIEHNDFTHLQAIVACECLEYQCNEHPDWDASISKEFLNHVRLYASAINMKEDNYSNRENVQWVIK